MYASRTSYIDKNWTRNSKKIQVGDATSSRYMIFTINPSVGWWCWWYSWYSLHLPGLKTSARALCNMNECVRFLANIGYSRSMVKFKISWVVLFNLTNALPSDLHGQNAQVTSQSLLSSIETGLLRSYLMDALLRGQSADQLRLFARSAYIQKLFVHFGDYHYFLINSLQFSETSVQILYT